LRLAKFQEQIFMKARHIYYIHGGFREVLRYSECPVCGTQIRLPPNTRLYDRHLATTTPVEQLVEQDPHYPLSQLQKTWESTKQSSTIEDRREHVLVSFCANAAQLFRIVEREQGGLAKLLWILLLIAGFPLALGAGIGARDAARLMPALATEADAIGVACGLVVALAWVGGYVMLYLAQVGRHVAQRLRPRLRGLLEDPKLEWSQLESALESGQLRFPRLCRHIRKSFYDEFRLGNRTPVHAEPACSMSVDHYLAGRREQVGVL
jgi:hypothetical protein